MTCEIPSDETERRSSMPLIVLTASSILSVISVSICSGAAPGWTVVTMTVGKSTFGKRSTPSLVNEKMPMTVSDRISTLAKTGRLTHRAASHCISHLALDLRAVVEFPDVARCDLLAGRDAFGDFDVVADGLTGDDDAFFHVIVRDDEHAARAGGRLHGCRWHENAGCLRRLLDARRREQARFQFAARVGYDGFDRQ